MSVEEEKETKGKKHQVISGEHDARIDWSWIHLDMGMGLKTGLETLESGLYLTGSRTPLVRLDGRVLAPYVQI